MSQTKQEPMIRRATLEDREAVLGIHGNVYDGLDYLPHFYDTYVSTPSAYPAVMLVDEKIVGFILCLTVDNSLTAIFRAGRLTPEYQGQGLYKVLTRHVAEWAVRRGVRSIVSTMNSPYDNRQKRPRIELFAWNYVGLMLDPQTYDLQPGDVSSAMELEEVLDSDLSALFNDTDKRKYIAPAGYLHFGIEPVKAVEESVPYMRGLSSVIYSDLNFQSGNGGCGLMSCCTKVKLPKATKCDYLVTFEIFGNDDKSLKKHVIRHLADLKNTSAGETSLRIVIPFEGNHLSELKEIMTAYKLPVDQSLFHKSDCPRFTLYEWWSRENEPGL